MSRMEPVTILLVEDDPADQKLIKRSLENQRIGNDLHIVSSGEEAMDFLHCHGEYSGGTPRPNLILLDLNMKGVAASSGSACTAKTLEPSHVLKAIGLKHEEAHGSVLFTLGRQNTEEEVDYVIRVMPEIVKRLRELSPLTPKELIE